MSPNRTKISNYKINEKMKECAAKKKNTFDSLPVPTDGPGIELTQMLILIKVWLFFCSKAFCQKIFCILFKASNH